MECVRGRMRAASARRLTERVPQGYWITLSAYTRPRRSAWLISATPLADLLLAALRASRMKAAEFFRSREAFEQAGTSHRPLPFSSHAMVAGDQCCSPSRNDVGEWAFLPLEASSRQFAAGGASCRAPQSPFYR